MVKFIVKIIKGIKKMICSCRCRSSCMHEMDAQIEIDRKKNDQINNTPF